jgi:hypothetical protein
VNDEERRRQDFLDDQKYAQEKKLNDEKLASEAWLVGNTVGPLGAIDPSLAIEYDRLSRIRQQTSVERQPWEKFDNEKSCALATIDYQRSLPSKFREELSQQIEKISSTLLRLRTCLISFVNLSRRNTAMTSAQTTSHPASA